MPFLSPTRQTVALLEIFLTENIAKSMQQYTTGPQLSMEAGIRPTKMTSTSGDGYVLQRARHLMMSSNTERLLVKENNQIISKLNAMLSCTTHLTPHVDIAKRSK